jgi:hypothetical protein
MESSEPSNFQSKDNSESNPLRTSSDLQVIDAPTFAINKYKPKTELVVAAELMIAKIE